MLSINAVVNQRKRLNSIMSVDILLYHKVKLSDGSEGIVRYIGGIMGKKGVFYGVDLTRGNAKNNGTVDGIEYFKTKKATVTGKFVSADKIKTWSKTKYAKYPFKLNQKVYCKKTNCNGVIKYIGVPAWTKDNHTVYYGLELDEKKGNTNGMMKKKIAYFKTKKKLGIYVPYTNIIDINAAKKTNNNNTKIKISPQKKKSTKVKKKVKKTNNKSDSLSKKTKKAKKKSTRKVKKKSNKAQTDTIPKKKVAIQWGPSSEEFQTKLSDSLSSNDDDIDIDYDWSVPVKQKMIDHDSDDDIDVEYDWNNNHNEEIDDEFDLDFEVHTPQYGDVEFDARLSGIFRLNIATNEYKLDIEHKSHSHDDDSPVSCLSEMEHSTHSFDSISRNSNSRHSGIHLGIQSFKPNDNILPKFDVIVENEVDTNMQLIDDALATYYKSLGRLDYFDKETKKSIFIQHCEDNNIAYSDIENYFKSEKIDDYAYLQFDTNFPLKLSNDVENDKSIDKQTKKQMRTAEMHTIIKYCYESKQSPY